MRTSQNSQMDEAVLSALLHVARILWDALIAISIPAAVFVALAIIVKGRDVFPAARRASKEMRINIGMHILDVMLVSPFVVALIAGIAHAADSANLRILRPGHWELLPSAGVIFVAVFAGDLVGYWRHRLEHTQFLWPSHAIHHSDTEMSWLTLLRFHPFNRFSTTFFDFSFLIILGFPEYAVFAAVFIRHNYGYLIHADLPWTFGKFGYVFVSPVMHRWHHARDPAAYGSNFATVFSILDRVFGTFRVPGPCQVPLGVGENMGKGVVGQLSYPFRLAAYSASFQAQHDLMRQGSVRAVASGPAYVSGN